MEKGIKSINFVNKKSAKGTEYSVINVELVTGKSFDLFVDSATKDLVDLCGIEDVALKYVTGVSKNEKEYSAIELKLKSDDSYTKLYFIDKAYSLIIKKLNEKK